MKKRAIFVGKVTIGEVSARSAGNDSRFGAETQPLLRSSVSASGIATGNRELVPHTWKVFQ